MDNPLPQKIKNILSERSFIYLCGMRNRDERKLEAIMNQALKMIVKTGFDGLSMQKLAKAAEVSPATIYIYFKDRDDLLLQLFRVELQKYYEAALLDFHPDMDFAEGMRLQWKNRVDFARKHREESHFLEHFSFVPLHAKALKMRDPKIRIVLKEFTGRAIQKKELLEMPVEVFWSVSFAPLYNLLRWEKEGKNMAGEVFELTDEILEQTLALTLKALKP
jgi:AcrR family transcriptional regulator